MKNRCQNDFKMRLSFKMHQVRPKIDQDTPKRRQVEPQHRFSIDFGAQVGGPRGSNESAFGSRGLSWRSFWANMAPRPPQDRFLMDLGSIFDGFFFFL